jgi:hypothetical protein
MPAKIVVMKDDQTVSEHQLDRTRMVIGRRAGTDITVVDHAVSGLHANILRIGDQFEIEDLNSTNGVHIGGRKIKRQILNDGDLIIIGEHQLKFIDGVLQEQSTYNPNERPARNKNTRGATGKKAALEPAYLMVMTGKDKNQQIELNEALTSIGEAGVQMAAISQRPDGHYIIHVDGGEDRSRVPVVNGVSIGFKSQKLEHSDLIEVAGIEMQYLLSDVTVLKLN